MSKQSVIDWRSPVAQKKPLISEKNAKHRYRFAKVNRRRPRWYWKRPVWSDECTLEGYGHNSKRHVYRPRGKAYDRKYLKSTVKFGGGKIMVGLILVFFHFWTLSNTGLDSRSGDVWVGMESVVSTFAKVPLTPRVTSSCWRNILCLQSRRWKWLLAGFFNRTRPRATPPRSSKNGLRTTMFRLCNGQRKVRT